MAFYISRSLSHPLLCRVFALASLRAGMRKMPRALSRGNFGRRANGTDKFRSIRPFLQGPSFSELVLEIELNMADELRSFRPTPGPFRRKSIRSNSNSFRPNSKSFPPNQKLVCPPKNFIRLVDFNKRSTLRPFFILLTTLSLNTMHV